MRGSGRETMTSEGAGSVSGRVGAWVGVPQSAVMGDKNNRTQNQRHGFGPLLGRMMEAF